MKDETLVVGGGIAGSSCAIALRRAGHACWVVERAEGFSGVGAGITVQPNAHAVLEALGVLLADRPVHPLARPPALRARLVHAHPNVEGLAPRDRDR